MNLRRVLLELREQKLGWNRFKREEEKSGNPENICLFYGVLLQRGDSVAAGGESGIRDLFSFVIKIGEIVLLG